MANFDFLKREDGYYDLFAEACIEAEKVYASSATMCAVACRKALELSVRWVYAADNTIQEPYRDNLASLIHEDSFRDCVDRRVWPGIRAIWKIGNEAVHSASELRPTDAIVLLRALFAFVEWIDFCYGVDYVERSFDEKKVPAAGITLTREQVAQLKAREADFDKQGEQIRQLEDQIRSMSDELTQARAANEQARSYAPPEDLSEFKTRKTYIDADLRSAGWDFDQYVVEEYEVHGMPVEQSNATGTGYIDYLLLGKDGKPLAVLEAKRTSLSATKGLQQARLYAACLQKQFGYAPPIFLSNGFETFFCDDATAPMRPVSGVFSQGELATILNRRSMRSDLARVEVNTDIAGGGKNRYYQIEAIRATCNNFEAGNRRSLLVMATGTGKTRVSAGLADVLMRANWVKNVLFLADRIALVSQAKHAFQQYLPEASLCNLCKSKDDREARIVFSTYPTILNAIDSARNDDGDRLFTPAHFDLIIIDEAHRSIFKKYKAIFEYFDALLVGLTATPANEVDRNTYDFFEVERGVPTYVYDYDTAVNVDRVLVPYLGIQTHTTFLDEGICYDDLSDDDKDRFEEDFGEAGEETPDYVPASDIDRWLFNEKTVDAVLQTLMNQGIKVDGGQTLGKTIVFASNRRHAEYIVRRFGELYPKIATGGYIKMVVHGDDYSHTIIDEFKTKPLPVICVSVDMMDTGVDVPEVVNLVFFKKVRSKIKFWQMIGRGTRLCPGLDVVDPLDESHPQTTAHPGGAYADKERFFIFDWCRNFEFFNQGGDEVEGRVGQTLSEAIFCRQARIAVEYQSAPYAGDEWQAWRSELVDTMHGQVADLAEDYDKLVSVRLQREAVEHFRKRSAYVVISSTDLGTLEVKLAPLVRNDDPDVNALRFDNLMYGYICALLDDSRVRAYQTKLTSISVALQQKITIPQVKEKLPVLQRVAEEGYLDNVTALDLERIRRELREIVRFVVEDGPGRSIIYTSLSDPVTSVEYSSEVAPREDYADYRLKVNRYLADYGDNIVIGKLRLNRPLTELDYRELERIFTQELGSADDYSRAYGETPFGLLVRQVVKLDHEAAMTAFAEFLSDNALSDQQMAFVHKVIEHIEANGYMELDALTRPPFDRPQTFVRLFDAKRQLRLVNIIRDIKGNALRPAA